MSSEVLPIPESKDLIKLERVIEKGKKVFVEVGMALAQIKAGRYWSLEYDSFESYCLDRWGWGKSYCYELIKSAEVIKSLPPEVSTVVENPKQAVELSRVAVADRAGVLTRAATTGSVTVRSIHEAANPVIDVDATTLKPGEDDKPHIHTHTEEVSELKPATRLTSAEKEAAEWGEGYIVGLREIESHIHALDGLFLALYHYEGSVPVLIERFGPKREKLMKDARKLLRDFNERWPRKARQ